MRHHFINGKIFTADPRRPWAEAFTIDGDGVAAVGAAGEILAGARPDEPVTDLSGKTVIPGFIDSHIHPAMTAEMKTYITCLPPAVNSLEDLARQIARRRAIQGPGRWVRGWGLDDGKLKERRMPTRHDLDRGAADVPVYITRNCEHVASCNTALLKLCGITAETPDSAGGTIGREPDGTPNGILYETAKDLAERCLPRMSVGDNVAELVRMGELLASEGVVAVTDMGDNGADVYRIYTEAAAKGFRQRTAIYFFWEYYWKDPAFRLTAEMTDPAAQVRAAGLKLMCDGSISGHTAWVREPYLGTDDCGLSVSSDELLDTAVEFCKANACQMAVHAMGARAIRRIVSRVAREENWMRTAAPYARIEHVTEPEREIIDLMAEKGIAVATQPLFFFSEIESYLKNYGLPRTQKAYPIRTMLERGVKVALSTDAPANAWDEPTDPFHTIQAAVTRTAYDGTPCGAQEAVDVETAVALYTRESAAVSGFSRLGQLAPGFEASFAVLDRDIFTVPPFEIGKVRPVSTWIGGEEVWHV